MKKAYWAFLLALACCLPRSGVSIAAPDNKAKRAEVGICSELVPPDKLKEDLDFLFKTIEDVHPNMYAYISEAEFAPHRENLYRQIDRPMTRLKFYKQVAPVLAKLKNGHTFVYPFTKEFKEYLEKGGKIFPLAIRHDGEDIILVRHYGSESLPMGGTILTIGGEDARQKMARFATYVAAECRETNPAILERDEMLWSLLWLEYGAAHILSIRIRGPGGTIKDYAIRAVTPEEAKAIRSEMGLRAKKRYIYRHLREYDTGIIEITSFTSTEQARFEQFLRNTFLEIQEKGVSNLIIDIRQNPGGDSRLSSMLLGYLTEKPIREFEEFGIKFSPQLCKAKPEYREALQRAFPERSFEIGSYVTFSAKDWPAQQPEENPLSFGGRTFVLVGPQTASTSVMFASAIRGLSVGTLVGAETMDTTSLYGECFNITLPNTGVQASVACKYFLLVGGKDDGRGLLPDYEVIQEPEDTAKGVDTALHFTLDLIQKEAKGEATK